MTITKGTIMNDDKIPSVDVKFDLEKDITVAFYDKDAYQTVKEAIINGALYHVISCISLWGKSGVHDLIDLANTMSKCSGMGNYVAVIKAIDGQFYDATQVLDLVPD
jgi:hypothetical protein